MPTTTLIEPHGGTLCELIVPEAEREALKEKALTLPSITLTPRQLCDIELLLNGGFSPLRGFLNRADYDRVVEEMRLQNGILWPMPITLDVSEEVARTLNPGDEVALRDPTGLLLAVMHVEDVWKPDKEREARLVFGTTSTEHPAVAYLMHEAGDYYVGGTLKGVQLPVHYDFKVAAPHAGTAPGRVRAAGMGAHCGLPDTESHAPGPQGTDRPRRRRGGRPPAHPSGGGHDEAR